LHTALYDGRGRLIGGPSAKANEILFIRLRPKRVEERQPVHTSSRQVLDTATAGCDLTDLRPHLFTLVVMGPEPAGAIR
jgi:hypothetical protein